MTVTDATFLLAPWPTIGTTGPGPAWLTSFSLRVITQCWCRLQVPCSKVTVPAPSPESPASPVLLGRNKLQVSILCSRQVVTHMDHWSQPLWALSLCVLFPSPPFSPRDLRFQEGVLRNLLSMLPDSFYPQTMLQALTTQLLCQMLFKPHSGLVFPSFLPSTMHCLLQKWV